MPAERGKCEHTCERPMDCKTCESCREHCAGMGTGWYMLRYYLRLWWQGRNQQGGWHDWF